ncbi:MAG TPA: hypothetical protein PK847_13770 [Candidatus Sumerlaeota bacterium]|nr:hypothetical protein [Candidatus Sumerlaeota bacterium]
MKRPQSSRKSGRRQRRDDPMALTQCRACGHGVSRNAAACPNCGEPIKKSPGSYGSWGCLLIIIVMMGACFHSVTTRSAEENLRHINNPDAWRSDDASSMAWTMMRGFVRDQLKAPKTADFPLMPLSLERDGQKHRIRGSVDSDNSFGAMIRTHFRGEVEPTSREQSRLNEPGSPA